MHLAINFICITFWSAQYYEFTQRCKDAQRNLFFIRTQIAQADIDFSESRCACFPSGWCRGHFMSARTPKRRNELFGLF